MAPTEAFRRTLKLASLVGCPAQGSTKQDIILCLTRKPADEIVAKEMGVATPGIGLNFSPFVVTADGRTVPAEPRKLLRKLVSRLRRLEVLVGSNEDEGSKSLMYFLPYLFPNKEVANPALTGHEFSSTVERIFADNSQQVCPINCFVAFACLIDRCMNITGITKSLLDRG